MNCYKCVYRGNVPGDAHSCCNHPEVARAGLGSGIFDAIIAMVTNPQAINAAARKLEIAADPHGVRSGWFMWPANFDPVWLRNCNGFTEDVKEEASC